MDSSTRQPSPHGFSERTRDRLFAKLHLRPLQTNIGGSTESGAREHERPETQSKVPHGRQQLLSQEQQSAVANKIKELSELPSPLVRELATKLASMYSIKVPKTERASTLAKCTTGGHSPYSNFHLGERWQELQGCSSWDRLLDPFDPDLKAEIVRYGEFAEACYDAFDNDSYSRYRGSCKYHQESLLEKVGLDNRGYEITNYIYATAELPYSDFLLKVNKAVLQSNEEAWSRSSTWMGFVAVCTSPQEIARLGRRDILVAWRGTGTTFEWIQNIQDYLKPAGLDPTANQGALGTRTARKPDEDVCMEAGFLSIYKTSNAKSRYNKKSAGDQVHEAIKNLVATYADDTTNLSITITGHSLGGALATICGYYIAQLQINCLSNNGTRSTDPGLRVQHCQPEAGGNPNLKQRTIPVTVYSFGSPRVGNEAFKNRVNELGVAVLRVVNKHDMVTKVPGKLFKHARELRKFLHLPFHPAYEHVGVELKIDHTQSEYLKAKKDYLPMNYLGSHNLEAYLHVVDGFHGSTEKFMPTLRDFALVNKRCNFLRKKYFIPPYWWQEEHKGLRRGEDGKWVVPKRGEDLFPDLSPGSNEQSEDLLHYVMIAVKKSLAKYKHV